MKSTIVPAQITTVEDRIAGSLSMSQLLLLIVPIFVDTAIYALLPRPLHPSAYKLVVMVVVASLCCLSAIRIKGQILLLWARTIARYNLRPRYYVYDRNSLHGRAQHQASEQALEARADDAEPVTVSLSPQLPLTDKIRVEALLRNPAANVRYETVKGGLRVRFTEVKE